MADLYGAVIHFLNGGISGAVGLIISHPFDTMKTCIQNDTKIQYNPRFLYRGVMSPLFGMILEKGIVFGTYENVYNLTNSHVLSGGISGFCASFIVTPFERIKILFQTNKNKKFDWSLLNRRYLFQGLSMTFTREIPGFAIYFTVYNHLKNHYYPENNIPPYSSFMFGGLSGAFSWLLIYPQDLVKTRMQASEIKISPQDVIKDIYRDRGIRGFFKGFELALMRAVPLHAGAFMANEWMKNWTSI